MNFKSREKLLASVAALSLLGISPQQTFAAQITTNQAVQQTKKITGNVSDAMGPIIGATVKVKGTKNAAVTDFDGNYTLNVGAGQTVEVTYVGYVTKTFKVGGQSKYDITLAEDNNSLDEVVVVGYGTMKKSDISGASVSMGEDQIKGSIITNLDQSFQGRVAGVTSVATSGAPGSSTSIRVRGQSTINAGAEPLYVIDGVIFQGGGSSGGSLGLGDALGNGSVSTVSPMSTINPADIVSMEILKDASATAIYGAQGANGVVLITTKRGKIGEAKFTYDGMAAWQYQGKRIDILNLREFSEYYNDFVNNGWISQDQARPDFSDPSILGRGTNWQDAVFRTAFQHQHQVAAQGGTEKVKYYVSGGMMDQDGTIIGSNFKRLNVRANLDAQLKKWFKIGMNTTYTRTKERLLHADGTEGVITYALTTPPDIAIYDVDGNYTSVVRDGSSNFGPENRWASFHSFAASWRFSNEKFIKSIAGKWLSNGKIRIGWGQTGNANIGAYKWGTTVTKFLVGQTSVAYRPTNIPNTSIKWETQEQTNIGLDLGLFNDKIGFTLDWYNKVSNDMLMPLQLPSYMGTQGNGSSRLNAPWGNYGKIKNTGFELAVNAHPIANKNFSWDTEFNISWNKNKLVGLSGTTNANIIGYGQWNDVVCVSNIGKPLYQFWGYQTDGVYKDFEDIKNSPKPKSYKEGALNKGTTVWPGDIKFKDISGPDGKPDGVIDDYDKTYIGNPQPKYTFGWTNTFRYKDFDLTLFVSGSVGNKVMNYLNISMSKMNNAWVNQSASVKNHAVLAPIDPNKDYSNGYKGNNANTVYNWYDDVDNIYVVNAGTNIPRLAIGDPAGNSSVISDRYVEDGSYLRMKNITLGYTLPKKYARYLHIESLRVYANIQNLFTITGYDGYDPEVGASTSDSQGYSFGVDNGRYPSPTVYSFGINLAF